MTDARTLQQLPHKRINRTCVYDWYGLEVEPWWLKPPYEGLEKSFKNNFDAVTNLNRNLPDMGRFLEMKEAAYVTLDSYEKMIGKSNRDIIAIVGGKHEKINLRMFPTQDRLDLALGAFDAVPLNHEIMRSPLDTSGTQMRNMTTAFVSHPDAAGGDIPDAAGGALGNDTVENETAKLTHVSVHHDRVFYPGSEYFNTVVNMINKMRKSPDASNKFEQDIVSDNRKFKLTLECKHGTWKLFQHGHKTKTEINLHWLQAGTIEKWIASFATN